VEVPGHLGHIHEDEEARQQQRLHRGRHPRKTQERDGAKNESLRSGTGDDATLNRFGRPPLRSRSESQVCGEKDALLAYSGGQRER
jgi:hypothetical protein